MRERARKTVAVMSAAETTRKNWQTGTSSQATSLPQFRLGERGKWGQSLPGLPGAGIGVELVTTLVTSLGACVTVHGQPRQGIVASAVQRKYLPPSSSGLGHSPLTAKTGVRVPLGVVGKPTVLHWLLHLMPREENPGESSSNVPTGRGKGLGVQLPGFGSTCRVGLAGGVTDDAS